MKYTTFKFIDSESSITVVIRDYDVKIGTYLMDMI